jgi:hypothetical protein
MELRAIRWAGHVARNRAKRNPKLFKGKELKQRGHLKYFGVDGR